MDFRNLMQMLRVIVK